MLSHFLKESWSCRSVTVEVATSSQTMHDIAVQLIGGDV